LPAPQMFSISRPFVNNNQLTYSLFTLHFSFV